MDFFGCFLEENIALDNISHSLRDQSIIGGLVHMKRGSANFTQE